MCYFFMYNGYLCTDLTKYILWINTKTIDAYCKNTYSVSNEIANRNIVIPILPATKAKKQTLFKFNFMKIPPLKSMVVIVTHFFYLSNR